MMTIAFVFAKVSHSEHKQQSCMQKNFLFNFREFFARFACKELPKLKTSYFSFVNFPFSSFCFIFAPITQYT